MYVVIASFICYFFLFTEGYAQGEQGFQSQQNVPKEAKDALLAAINEKRISLGVTSLKGIDYDYKLARKSEGTPEGLLVLDGKSTFKDSWKETMKNALTSSRNEMIKVAEKIGCEITLSTSTNDGSHNLKLHCNLQMPKSFNVVDDI